MLKYGEILTINNSNSKTLLPRNLTYNNTILTQNINGLSTSFNNSTNQSTIQTSGTFNSATITDLAVGTISVIPNTLGSNIVVNSPIAFSILKSEYQSNNFILYPIFFSQNIFI